MKTTGRKSFMRERSWTCWISLLPGGFALLFSAGEIIFQH